MSPHLPPREFLTEFLLTQIARQPLAERVLLYRALAVDTDDEQLRAQCNTLADEYEAVARQERQMLLDFQRRAAL